MGEDAEVLTLTAWLESIGLGQYAKVLRQNDVDLPELGDLTEGDLRELGFSLGHRKILARAIAGLSGQSDAPRAERGSERRNLSVMFCDLIGSTALAQKYDAEDLAEILRVYRQCCDEAVQAMNGVPLGKQGDGYVAVFGYPRAREDDAERAVNAALDIVERVVALRPLGDEILHTRIAVSTGRVVVGDITADDGAIAGSTLNLAARLQDIANPDSVVIGPSTQRLVSSVVDLKHHGRHELKGFTEPVDAWLVQGARESGSRLRSGSGHTSDQLIGRDSELEALRGIWRAATEGQGGVAVVNGDPGIGKSRLLEAFCDEVREECGLPLRFFCVERFANSALRPVAAEIKRQIGLTDSDDPDTRIARLEQMFDHKPAESVPLIASLLSIPLPEHYQAQELTTLQQKTATFRALRTQLEASAKASPLLILFEDAHWSDPTTIEFLSHIVHEVVVDAPIMLIVTHRPSFEPGWPEGGHIAHVRLDRLDEALSQEIIARAGAGGALPVETVRDIVEKADGVPLFIEELTRAVSEAQASGRDVSSGARLEVPDTLEDSLMARLDRLSSAKSVAQLAAVIGRRFSVSLLRRLTDLNDDAFERALHELERSGLARPIGHENDDHLIFKHALIQQAAYSSLLRRQRQELHQRIAQILMDEQPDLATREPETLSWHYAGANMAQEASHFMTEAGRKAVSRAAHIEAINHFNSAIEQLMNLPASAERSSQEVFLHALLGGALMSVRGFAAPEVHDAFARAREICIELGDSPMFCSAMYGLLTVNASRSDQKAATALADEMMSAFADCPVPSWSVAAHFAAGFVDMFQGKFEVAQERFLIAVERYTPDQHSALVEQFGDNLAEFSYCYLSWIGFLRGTVERQAEFNEMPQKLADETRNRGGQVRNLAFIMGQLQERGDVEEVSKRAPEIISMATELGYPYWATVGQMGLGWAMSHQGATTQGIEMIEAALGFLELIGQKTPQTYWRTYLIDALLREGSRERALEVADVALAQCRDGLDRFYTAELLRQKGEALRLEPADDAAAEACFRESIDWAAERGIRLHVLYGTDSLARLLAGQGRGHECREALAAAIAGYESLSDFPRLAAARSLLASLD